MTDYRRIGASNRSCPLVADLVYSHAAVDERIQRLNRERILHAQSSFIHHRGFDRPQQPADRRGQSPHLRLYWDPQSTGGWVNDLHRVVYHQRESDSVVFRDSEPPWLPCYVWGLRER